MQEYGQLDLMFANAGIATAGWVYNHPPQDWAWAMNTNVLGLTYYVHEVLPIFKQQGTPCHFLFTASIAACATTRPTLRASMPPSASRRPCATSPRTTPTTA